MIERIVRPKLGGVFVIGACVLVTACSRNDEPSQQVDKPMSWDDPLDPAAVTLREIVERKRPILLVTHDAGHGGWQFMDGKPTAGRKPLVVPKADLIEIDPTIKEVLDLPVGWRAFRSSPDANWRREAQPQRGKP